MGIWTECAMLQLTNA